MKIGLCAHDLRCISDLLRELHAYEPDSARGGQAWDYAGHLLTLADAMDSDADADREAGWAAYERHRTMWAGWTEGAPVDIWRDADGTLCVRYESGRWWHYGDDDTWW